MDQVAKYFFSYWNMLNLFARFFRKKGYFVFPVILFRDICRASFFSPYYFKKSLALLECTTMNIYQYLTKYFSHISSFFLYESFFLFTCKNHTVFHTFFHCAIVRKLAISPGLILLWFGLVCDDAFCSSIFVQSFIPFFVPKAF